MKPAWVARGVLPMGYRRQQGGLRRTIAGEVPALHGIGALHVLLDAATPYTFNDALGVVMHPT